ncbi:MAG: hypothetical protein GC164_03740 [Phycisphaera sp.]|nr:hypothetical protein [Phycisphaera sp.]
MPQPELLILASGGMRSLVATSLGLESTDPGRVVLLHVKDGRACGAVRLEHARRQADHYKVKQFHVMDLPNLQGRGAARTQDGSGLPLIRPQILLIALARAIEFGTPRVIWPVQANADLNTITRTSEQVLLLQQTVELEHPQQPLVQTPLLELTDRQLVELGVQQDVPWEKAWSCQMAGTKPCKSCETCRRRKAAFIAAGVVDPVETAVATAR